MSKALRSFIDNDAVRDALLDMSEGDVLADHPVPANEMFEAVADFLTDQHARLLMRVGYRTPPPPPAHQLVENTRRAVLEPTLGLPYGSAHIEQLYATVHGFLDELEDHIGKNKEPTKRLLARQRSGGIVALLATVVSMTTIKPGDEFDIGVEWSGRDGFGVEVTVPASLGVDLFGKVLAASAARAVSAGFADPQDRGETVDGIPQLVLTSGRVARAASRQGPAALGASSAADQVSDLIVSALLAGTERDTLGR